MQGSKFPNWLLNVVDILFEALEEEIDSNRYLNKYYLDKLINQGILEEHNVSKRRFFTLTDKGVKMVVEAKKYIDYLEKRNFENLIHHYFNELLYIIEHKKRPSRLSQSESNHLAHYGILEYHKYARVVELTVKAKRYLFKIEPALA